jgi:uncharacterized membrane protein
MRLLSKTVLTATVLVLAIFGLADAVYLSAKTLTGGAVSCSLTGGCGAVLNSNWSTIFSVPTAFYGVAYYGVIAIFSGGYLFGDNELLLQLLVGVTTVGMIFSGFLVYLQAFVIEAFCQYCLVSALLTVVACGLSWLIVARFGWYNTSEFHSESSP